jgi:magnesium-transporting ATPase (P-type)
MSSKITGYGMVRRENARQKKLKPARGPEEILFLPTEEVFARLGTSQSGLTSEEAKKRLEIYGYNEFAKKKRTALAEFLSHFKSPLVIILLVAGVISAFLGELVNAIIISVIVLLSTLLLFYQESRAEKASEMLRKKVTTTATVLRDGEKKEVDLREIVPGDIIHLSAGDIVPADARVISAKDLFVNQSALTGESLPVEKTSDPLATREASITEWNNYLFLGIKLVLHVDPEGRDDDRVLLFSFLNSYYQTGLKSPLDEAILKYEEIDVKGYQKIDEIPFDFERKRVSVVVECDGQRILISKGAPEQVLATCSNCELSEGVFELNRALRDRVEQNTMTSAPRDLGS